MANVKIIALEDGDTWATFGSIIELKVEDYEKLLNGDVTLGDLYQSKSFVSERDIITNKEVE